MYASLASVREHLSRGDNRECFSLPRGEILISHHFSPRAFLVLFRGPGAKFDRFRNALLVSIVNNNICNNNIERWTRWMLLNRRLIPDNGTRLDLNVLLRLEKSVNHSLSPFPFLVHFLKTNLSCFFPRFPNTFSENLSNLLKRLPVAPWM